jgi:hypothetical protein
MADRIDGNRSASPSPTQTPSTEETSKASQTGSGPGDITDQTCANDDPQSFFSDTWEQDCDAAETFMTQASAGGAARGNSGSASGGSVSLLELQAQSATAATSGDSTAANPMADKLTELLGGSGVDFEDIKYCTDAGRSFGPINQALTGLSGSERKALAEIVANPDEGRAFFREALQGRDDIHDGLFSDRNEEIDLAADALLEAAQTQIVGNFKEQVAQRVRGIVRHASEPYQAINASGDSRRAFLGQLATLEGDPAKLEQRLVAFGLEEDAAGDIATVLSEVHADPSALDALISGDAGPDRDGIHLLEEGNAYAFAEELLGEQLDDKLDIMEQVSRQAGNGQINDSLLTNDNFKILRDRVLSEMEGGKDGPIEAVIADFTEEVESDQVVEDVLKIGIATITAVGVTVATGGLGGAAAVGAAMATGGAQVAPDVLVAWEDVDLAEMAAQKELVMPDGTTVSIGMTDEAAVDKARYNRNVTTACAVAGMVLGAAPAKTLRGGATIAGGAALSSGTADAVLNK